MICCNKAILHAGRGPCSYKFGNDLLGTTLRSCIGYQKSTTVAVKRWLMFNNLPMLIDSGGTGYYHLVLLENSLGRGLHVC